MLTGYSSRDLRRCECHVLQMSPLLPPPLLLLLLEELLQTSFTRGCEVAIAQSLFLI